jgi:hypothetical protein
MYIPTDKEVAAYLRYYLHHLADAGVPGRCILNVVLNEDIHKNKPIEVSFECWLDKTSMTVRSSTLATAIAEAARRFHINHALQPMKLEYHPHNDLMPASAPETTTVAPLDDEIPF